MHCFELNKQEKYLHKSYHPYSIKFIIYFLFDFRSRLKAKNLMYIKQIVQILSSWIRCLGGKIGCAPDMLKTGPTMSKLYTINNFLFATQMDNINLFKVHTVLLLYELDMYNVKIAENVECSGHWVFFNCIF